MKAEKYLKLRFWTDQKHNHASNVRYVFIN